MSCLATPKKDAQEGITPIIESIENSTTKKFLLILWSCYGMKALTEKRYDEEVRDVLLREIRKKHKILQYLPFKYCDNHIPIKAEILALRRKK
jgi:hypothetical protein